MAQIERRNNGYRVRIRRLGFTPISKTFTLLKSARQFAKECEVNIDNHSLIYKPNEKHSLKDIVHRYMEEVVPYKKSSKPETYLLKQFLKLADFSNLIINDVKPFFSFHQFSRVARDTPRVLETDSGVIKFASSFIIYSPINIVINSRPLSKREREDQDDRIIY